MEPRVLVVGDVMRDRTIYGNAHRLAYEAPVPVIDQTHVETVLGGAGNVAANVVSLGVACSLCSCASPDEEGLELAAMLQRAKVHDRVAYIAPHALLERNRLYLGDHLHARWDAGANLHLEHVQRRVLDHFRTALDHCPVAAVVISDYGKGVVSWDPQAFIHTARSRRPGTPILVDPRNPNLAAYRGASLIKPNVREARAALRFAGMPGVEDASYEALVRGLSTHCPDCDICLTCGADGLYWYSARRGTTHHEPALSKRGPLSVQGAGDTAMAALAICFAERLPLSEAAPFVATAAGLAVAEPGTTAVQRAAVDAEMSRYRVYEPVLHTLDEVRKWADDRRAAGVRIVATNGCFDLCHPGHVRLLEFAAGLGDAVIVGINDDAGVRKVKGFERPLIPEDDRANMLASLMFVDAVHVFAGTDPRPFIAAVKPDVLVKGHEYLLSQVPGEELLPQWGGRLRFAPRTYESSTTELIKKIDAEVSAPAAREHPV